MPVDQIEAIRLYRKAAEQGHVFDSTAPERTTTFWFRPGPSSSVTPPPKPASFAERFYDNRDLAEQGIAGNQNLLGNFYYLGLFVKKDFAEATKWFRRAAEQGNPYAQYNLGVMLEQGRGALQDYAEAHKWFNLAASRFPSSEEIDREAAIARRNSLALRMSAVQIAEAQKLARDWKPASRP